MNSAIFAMCIPQCILKASKVVPIKQYCWSFESNIGIDIQLRSSKLNIIQSKFINQNDTNSCFNSEEFLHHAWSSKEAIYKTLNGSPCSFKKNVFIKNLTNSESLGLYKKDKQKINFKIYHEVFENYFISIAKKIT